MNSIQTLKNIARKDTVIQERQREISRNLDSGFIRREAGQAECAVYGHEWFTYNELTQCFFCGAKPE